MSGVTWEALEHSHGKKSSDWFWALGIIVLSASIAAIFFKNTLLALIIILGGGAIFLLSRRPARVISYTVSPRCLSIDNDVYPYSVLESYCIDEHSAADPQLILKTQSFLFPLLIVPLPIEMVDEIENLLSPRLKAEHLEEPLANKVLEFFGF